MTKVTPVETEIQKPLSDFKVIGHNTYVWTPSSYDAKSPLILLFTWNAAAAKHIAKYTASYQRLFLNARIVLIRCFTLDGFRRAATYPGLLKSGMEVVHEHTRTGGKLLVHSFSNGGANQVNQFAKAWLTSYGEPLPTWAQILDSGPAMAPWMRTHKAILASFPKGLLWQLFGTVLIHAALFAVFILRMFTWQEHALMTICREGNDDKVFDKKVPRVYMYSRADEMLAYEDIEKQIDDAEAKGWSVKRVRFEKSAHAGHVREDEDKYWGSILEAWKAGPRKD